VNWDHTWSIKESHLLADGAHPTLNGGDGLLLQDHRALIVGIRSSWPWTSAAVEIRSSVLQSFGIIE